MIGLPKILAIDDTPANLATLGAVLASDFDLQIATSGEKGLSLAMQSPPDLILLDVMMPVMDGYETCRRLKAEPTLRNIPVVFVTALSEVASEMKGLALGAADYLGKPINVDIARQRIRNLLEREGLRKEVEAQRDLLAVREVERTMNLQRMDRLLAEQKAILDNDLIGIVTVRERKIVWANPAFEKILGYEPGELAGTPTQQNYPSEEAYRAFGAAAYPVLSTGNVFRAQIEHRRKDGKHIWVDLSGALLNRETGESLWGFVDITQRKETEQALQAALLLSEDLYNNAPGGYHSIGPDGTFFRINDTELAWLGYRREELLGRKKLADLLTPASQEAFSVHFPLLQSGGKIDDLPLDMVRKDGSILQVLISATAVMDAQGQFLMSRTTVYDLTEKKRIEAQLLQLSWAVEQSTESIVITDLEAKIEYVNAAFSRISGYSREEALGQNPSVLQSGQTPTETFTELWATLQSGQAWRGEFINRRQNGEIYIEDTVITPIRQPDGRLTHYLAVKQDVTEKRRVAEELDRHRHHLEAMVEARTAALSIAKEAAEAANRAKSTFLANMSHELRTPMNGIMGMTELALRRATDDHQKKQLDTVRKSSLQLLAVINDILDLSKIEAERLTLEQIDFNLDSVLENIRHLVEGKVSGSGPAFVIDISRELKGLTLQGDPLRLTQVLLNLVGNAIKFTPQGSVTVRARLAEEHPSEVLLRFEVRDTGVGLSPEAQTRIFCAFEQADNSTTRKYGGTGLGLTISKCLVLMMGGDIGVYSEVGKGSTFWFTVCLRKIHHGLAPSLPHDALSDEDRLTLLHAGARILLVEDEPINQEVAREQLEEAGLMVDLAANGAEAVALERLNAYDLILMDMQMPVMDGLQATRQIRQLPGREALPILAMTANAYSEDREKCLAAGMNDFLTKPVASETLYAMLLNWLNQRME